MNRGKRCARHLVSTVRGRHGRRTAFLSVRLIGPVRPPVAENPQAAGKSAVLPRCFLTVQRGARSLPVVEADVMSTLYIILVVPSVAIFIAHMIDAIRS